LCAGRHTIDDIHKREYNSERRRKLEKINAACVINILIRENITPRGDGNLLGYMYIK